MTNKSQTILLSIAFIAALVGINEYVTHNKPEHAKECKGAISEVKNEVLCCWNGAAFVKPERL